MLTNHQFFNRLAEAFIAEVTRVTPEGVLYRIDLRLRPEGDAGPLSRSLAGYENYYAQWGQTWERMMLIKARGLGGDEALAAEFLEMVQPFRYPRSINQGALQEMAAMKDRIENEVVKAGELERNVNLGHGGIRGDLNPLSKHNNCCMPADNPSSRLADFAVPGKAGPV